MENLCRKAFFEIIERILQGLHREKEIKNLFLILDALKWKYSASDHTYLIKLNVFKRLCDNNRVLEKAWKKKEFFFYQ
jgi:hypothetical protein